MLLVSSLWASILRVRNDMVLSADRRTRMTAKTSRSSLRHTCAREEQRSGRGEGGERIGEVRRGEVRRGGVLLYSVLLLTSSLLRLSSLFFFVRLYASLFYSALLLTSSFSSNTGHPPVSCTSPPAPSLFSTCTTPSVWFVLSHTAPPSMVTVCTVHSGDTVGTQWGQ